MKRKHCTTLEKARKPRGRRVNPGPEVPFSTSSTGGGTLRGLHPAAP